MRQEQHTGYSDGSASLFSQVWGMKQLQGEILVMWYVKCLFSLQGREYFSEYYVLVPWFPAIIPVLQRAVVKASDDEVRTGHCSQSQLLLLSLAHFRHTSYLKFLQYLLMLSNAVWHLGRTEIVSSQFQAVQAPPAFLSLLLCTGRRQWQQQTSYSAGANHCSSNCGRTSTIPSPELSLLWDVHFHCPLSALVLQAQSSTEMLQQTQQ